MKKPTRRLSKDTPTQESNLIDVQAVFPSLNSWYASKHWTQRHKNKQEIQSLFMAHFAKHSGLKLFQFRVHYRYNNRYDCDNTIPAIKILVDTMKTMGIIIDDSPKYFLGLSIENDKSLRYNQHIFEIKGIKDHGASGTI